MLALDNRAVAVELLRPPNGYRLDLAILTTYTLNLETLLALPLAVFAHQDATVDELLHDPVPLLQCLRDVGQHIHVFVDETGIHIPQQQHPIVVALQDSVHMVRAPNGGVFHPKLWIARFISDNGDPRLRVAILSRNLTFDRSLDLAMVSEATPGEQRFESSESLSDLLRQLKHMRAGGSTISPKLNSQLDELGNQVARCQFPSPEGFHSPITFQASGITESATWHPTVKNSQRVLAMSPFVTKTTLNEIRELGGNNGDNRLIGRAEELDSIPCKCLEEWDEINVLVDFSSDEAETGEALHNLQLHAKFLLVENKSAATWIIGSANHTDAARSGNNVEVTAQLTGPTNRVGIDQFWDDFKKLCESYTVIDREIEVDEEERKAKDLLRRSVREFLRSHSLEITCKPSKSNNSWNLDLCGDFGAVDEGVTIRVWPISVNQKESQRLNQQMRWQKLTVPRLTSFVAFEFTARKYSDVQESFVLNLPISGLPKQHVDQVLRSLIDSTDKLLQFLRLLLGGFDELGAVSGSGSSTELGFEALFVDSLLEDLVRTASRSPKQLEPFRRLIEELQKDAQGRALIPAKLDQVWKSVESAIN